MKTLTVENLKKVAKDLIDDGTNVEYVRGICELIADVDGIEGLDHAERAMQIGVELGLSINASAGMYNKPLIGYQIVSKDGSNTNPDEFYSFEVLTEEVKNFWMEHYDDGTWQVIEIFEGDIVEPEFVDHL